MKKNAVKLLAMLMLCAVALVALASCGIVTSGEYRFGVATVDTGSAQVAAAVILDASDRIALVRIDEIENGNTESKKDLGDKYGMVAYGGAKAEWYEQIAHLERTLVGKKLDEIAGVTKDDADVSAGCTIKVNHYVTAVAKAAENAKAAETFKSTVDHLAISLAFTAGNAGEAGEYVVAVTGSAFSRGYTVAQISTFCGAIPTECRFGLATVTTTTGKVAAAVVVDENNRIVLVSIDEVDTKDGVTDSKKVQGDAYGMLAAWGSQLAEWDDQIAHLEKKLVGKNAEQVAGVKSSDADIAAGCTVGIDNYKAAVIKAMENAKTSESFYSLTANLKIELTFDTVKNGDKYEISVSSKASANGTKLAEKAIEHSDAAEYRFGFGAVPTSKGLVAAGVVIDSNNKIVLVYIDEVDTTHGTDSKKTQGDAYGMLGAQHGSTLAEWDDQIAYLEAYLIGKSSEEVAGLEDKGDADISAGCTVAVSDYRQAVIDAIANAKGDTAITKVITDLTLNVTITVTSTAGTYECSAVAKLSENGAVILEKDMDDLGTTPDNPGDPETPENPDTPEGPDTPENPDTPDTPAIPQALRFGFATVTTSKGIVAATVLIDADGKVVAVLIDEVDTSKGVTDSKKVQGASYGMLSAWGSQLAEWNDQIAYLEAYMIGKSATEISGLADDDDVDLVGGCTIAIGTYKQAVINAINNAKNSTATTKIAKNLALSLDFNVTGTTGAYEYDVAARLFESGTKIAEKSTDDRQTQALRFGFATVTTAKGMVAATVLVDADGKVVAVLIDEVDTSGGKTDSKKVQGDAYGMLSGYGSQLAEWDDQIAHLEVYLIGKTSAELTGLDTSDADLTAGCTVYIGNYVQAVIDAIADAQNNKFTAVASTVTLTLEFDVSAFADGYNYEACAEVFEYGVKTAEKKLDTPEELKLGIGKVETTGKGMVAATVVIDARGRIVAVLIDEMDISGGKTDSKKTQGDAYGMLSGYGSQLAEWDDQIAHLEVYLIGKTSAELTGLDTSDADLTAGCTVYIGNYVQAVINAISDAGSKTAFTADKSDIDLALSLTAVANGSSYDITANATEVTGGSASASCTYTPASNS